MDVAEKRLRDVGADMHGGVCRLDLSRQSCFGACQANRGNSQEVHSQKNYS